jgi:hypothetical protein
MGSSRIPNPIGKIKAVLGIIQSLVVIVLVIEGL